MLDEIIKLDSQIADLQAQREDAVKRYVAECCDVKVGNTVTVNGYRQTGKKMIVDFVTLKKHYADDQYYFFASGRVLKKNNEPSAYRAEWHSNR
jgi:predicted AAA+ superfamily ATPase